MIKENLKLNLLAKIFIVFISFYIIFGRSLSGVFILDFRLAEIIIGLSVFFSISILFLNKIDKKLFIDFKHQLKIFFLLILFFIVTLIVTNGSFLNTYTYKSSSYIWTIAVLFFTYSIFKNVSINKNYLYIFSFSLFFAYFFSTIKYPEVFINFFTDFSDKWDFIKASDIFLAFVFTNTLNYLFFNKKIYSFTFFLFSSAILLPLFLFMSKGSFFPSIIYIFSFLFLYFEIIRKNKFKSFLIFITSIILFVVSTYEIYGNLNFEKGIVNFEQSEVSNLGFDHLKRGVEDIAQQKGTDKIFASLFFAKYTGEVRLYSTDLMLDWRLQIWQDIVNDLYNKNKLIFGYGYNEIIPIMNSVERMGNDGTNENVHNYFFNILARGGLVQLLLIILFIFFMIYEIKDKNLQRLFIIYTLPLYLTSFFDASMESVRFPTIFYFGIAIIFKIDKFKA